MRTLRLLFVGLMLLLIVGCGPKVFIDDFTNDSYFIGQAKKMAVLPIVNTQLNPNRAHQIDTAVTKMLKSKNPSIIIVDVPEATKAINKYKLADQWADFIRNYATSGIPDAQILRAVGKAINVDAVIQGKILNLAFVHGIYGERMARTSLELRYSLFSCQNGELLWQATFEGYQMASAISAAPPAEPILEAIIDKMSIYLPSL